MRDWSPNEFSCNTRNPFQLQKQTSNVNGSLKLILITTEGFEKRRQNLISKLRVFNAKLLFIKVRVFINRSITTVRANGVFNSFSNRNVFATNLIILFFQCTIISSLMLCLQMNKSKQKSKSMDFYGDKTKKKERNFKRKKKKPSFVFFCFETRT